MTDKLMKILESLELEDIAAAEAALTEWFDSVSIDEAEEESEEQIDEANTIEPEPLNYGKFIVKDENGKVIGMGLDKEAAEEYAQFNESNTIEPEPMNYGKFVVKDETGKVIGMGLDKESAEEYAQFNESEEDPVAEGEEEAVEESLNFDPQFEALAEEFKGFSVVDKLANKEGAQVGNADAVPVNSKSPLPNNKASQRVAGHPVHIHADEHHGYDAETPPSISEVKPKNAAPKPKREEVKDETGALLNKVEGSINDVSPIGSKSRK